MKKETLKVRALIALCLVLALTCQEAYAWGGGHGGRGGGRDYHYYRDGRWYQHGWLWLDTAVTALTIGALVDSLPPRSTTVVYGGMPYYYFDGYYYRPYRYGGYMVVRPPVVAQPVAAVPSQPAIIEPQMRDGITVNIPNSRGSYTAVTLKRSGNGFIGPQGEYYAEFPTVEQLKVIYGK